MKKSPFLIFSVVISVLVAGVIFFIQSPLFAKATQSVLVKYAPKNLGVQGNFSSLRVKLFPPGISVLDPSIRLTGQNPLNLPAGSEFVADRLDLEFRPLQMFSGKIRVHEVGVIHGKLKLILSGAAAPVAKKARRLGVNWDELFQVRADSISLKDTQVVVQSDQSEVYFQGDAELLKIAQWSAPGGIPGYELFGTLRKASAGRWTEKQLPEGLDWLQAHAQFTSAKVNIPSLELKTSGLHAQLKGEILGNVLEPKDLKAKGEWTVSGSLEKLTPIHGSVDVRGKFLVDLDHPTETFQTSGELSAQNLKYESWSWDQFSTEFQYNASPAGGDLELKQVRVESEERPRVGVNQPGRGGKVKVAALKISLAPWFKKQRKETIELSVPVELQRAHLHSLIPNAIDSIYGLDLRLSGAASIEVTLPPPPLEWSLSVHLGGEGKPLEVRDLRLDNQKFGKTKPLNTILQIPVVRIVGDAEIDPHSIMLNDVLLSPGASVLEGGGIIRLGGPEKAVFDLKFEGPMQLQEVGQIAETDIRGRGRLKAKVTGPSSGVLLDFGLDLKDAEYLGLQLGDLRGRIFWDDGHDILGLEHLEGLKGKTSYRGDGRVDLGPGKDQIQLDIQIPKGEVQDLLSVFERKTRSLTWLPRDLTGSLQGDARLTGGVSMSQLNLLAHLRGEEWEQWSERFSRVNLTGGYDRGTYFVSDLQAKKGSGMILGKVSYAADDTLDWQVRTERFSLSDLDRVASLAVPMRGKLKVESSGRGKFGALQSSTRLSLENFSVRGMPMPPTFLDLKSDLGVSHGWVSIFGGQATLKADYDFSDGKRSEFSLNCQAFDFSPALLLLNPSLLQDTALLARLTGGVRLSFDSGKVELANGKLELKEYRLAKTGTSFQLERPVDAQIELGSFDLPQVVLKGPSADSKINLRGRKGDLTGSLTGGLDLSLIEFLTSAVSEGRGLALLDLGVNGQLKNPNFFGKGSLEGGSIKVVGLDSPIENLTGSFHLKQGDISVSRIQGDLAGGRITAEGEVKLFTDRVPELGLKGSLTGSKLKFYPFQFVKVRGDLSVHGKQIPYEVDGSLIVDSGLVREKVMGQKAGATLKTSRYNPPPSSGRLGDYPLFKLNIGVEAPGGILIQNDLFDAEAKGRVTVVNTIETPRILGTAELVSGRLLFKDRVFQIQSATANFDNPTVINPSFNLIASTEVNQIKIQMDASGRADQLKLSLTSNPVMSENDILSLLALGVASGDTRKLGTVDRSLLQQGEAASLILHSLDFNREVESKTGFQIQVDESTAAQQQGTSIFRPQSTSDSVVQPKIVIRRQIGKKFDLSYGTTLGGPTTATERQVNAEYHFTPAFSVMGVWFNYQSIDTQERTSIGLDLNFQKRFK